MVNVIDTASSCNWFSCCSSEKDIESGELKGRVCPYWRVIPGVVALIASVTAVVCALLWNSPYLCIAFAPGALASMYLIYLGWDFRNLTSFADNNTRLNSSIIGLQKEKEALQGKLCTFEEENKKLTQSRQGLEQAVTKLRDENTKLTNANAQLNKTAEILANEAQQHLTQLSALENGLIALQSSAKADHTTFAGNLKVLIEEIAKLQTTRQDFEKTGNTVEQKMQKTTTLLQTIFTEICEWKSTNGLEKIISTYQKFQQDVSSLQIRLAADQARFEEQKQHLRELAEVHSGFTTALKDLKTQIGGLQDVKSDLKATVDKVSTAIAKMQRYAEHN